MVTSRGSVVCAYGFVCAFFAVRRGQGIPKESWDALLRPEESPFLEHDWLRAMETSKCATVDTGGSHTDDSAVFGSQALGPQCIGFHAQQ